MIQCLALFACWLHLFRKRSCCFAPGPIPPPTAPGLVGGHCCQAAPWRGLAPGHSAPRGEWGHTSPRHPCPPPVSPHQLRRSALRPRPRGEVSLHLRLEVWESRQHRLPGLPFAPLWLSAPGKHRASEKPGCSSRGQAPVSTGGGQVPPAPGTDRAGPRAEPAVPSPASPPRPASGRSPS